jgi:hypothetical protein
MSDQDQNAPVDPVEPVEPQAPEEDGEPKEDDCPHCVKAAADHAANEEMNLAILIALVPALTLTFLSSAGFI